MAKARASVPITLKDIEVLGAFGLTGEAAVAVHTFPVRKLAGDKITTGGAYVHPCYIDPNEGIILRGIASKVASKSNHETVTYLNKVLQDGGLRIAPQLKWNTMDMVLGGDSSRMRFIALRPDELEIYKGALGKGKNESEEYQLSNSQILDLYDGTIPDDADQSLKDMKETIDNLADGVAVYTPHGRLPSLVAPSRTASGYGAILFATPISLDESGALRFVKILTDNAGACGEFRMCSKDALNNPYSFRLGTDPKVGVVGSRDSVGSQPQNEIIYISQGSNKDIAIINTRMSTLHTRFATKRMIDIIVKFFNFISIDPYNTICRSINDSKFCPFCGSADVVRGVPDAVWKHDLTGKCRKACMAACNAYGDEDFDIGRHDDVLRDEVAQGPAPLAALVQEEGVAASTMSKGISDLRSLLDDFASDDNPVVVDLDGDDGLQSRYPVDHGTRGDVDGGSLTQVSELGAASKLNFVPEHALKPQQPDPVPMAMAAAAPAPTIAPTSASLGDPRTLNFMPTQKAIEDAGFPSLMSLVDSVKPIIQPLPKVFPTRGGEPIPDLSIANPKRNIPLSAYTPLVFKDGFDVRDGMQRHPSGKRNYIRSNQAMKAATTDYQEPPRAKQPKQKKANLIEVMAAASAPAPAPAVASRMSISQLLSSQSPADDSLLSYPDLK